MSMDPSFKDRVDKVFGSISSSSSSSSPPWSLTGAHRLWNPDRVSSPFQHNFFSFQRKPFHLIDEDEWDIRSSIGFDSTLDNEEEEDAYDKMAQGREDGYDHVYMKDVADHGPCMNSHNVHPGSVNDVKKDPRANHDAVKTGLNKDEDMDPCVDGIRIKSILKRKSDMVVKPEKRVRFDPTTCKNDDELTNTIQPRQQKQGIASENGCNVPDYILNPSKYIQYNFDDISHDSNSKDYKDFHEQVKQSNHVELEQKSGESSAAVPRSVPFIPRKKRGGGKAYNSEGQVKQSSIQAAPGICFDIAALEEAEKGEIIEMQEDELHADSVCTFQKPGRRYRSKR